MTELVVVPFSDYDHRGRTTGDSNWCPSFTIPYEEGMTVEDVRARALAKLRVNWFADEADTPEAIAEFQESDVKCTGGWVISQRDLAIINAGEIDAGGDSALYAILNHMKCQIEAASIKTIE